MREGSSHNGTKQQVRRHVCRTAGTALHSRRQRRGPSPADEGCSLVLQRHYGYLWGRAPSPQPSFQSIPPHSSKPPLPGIGVTALPAANPLVLRNFSKAGVSLRSGTKAWRCNDQHLVTQGPQSISWTGLTTTPMSKTAIRLGGDLEGCITRLVFRLLGLKLPLKSNSTLQYGFQTIFYHSSLNFAIRHTSCTAGILETFIFSGGPGTS